MLDESRLQEAKLGELRTEIAALTARNRDARDVETERRLLTLRHLVGARLLAEAPDEPRFADPAESVPEGSPLPEFDRTLTAAQLRAAILRDGCALVRGLIDRERALRFASEIDRAFALRADGAGDADGYYEAFRPHAPFGKIAGRSWIEQGGGLLAIDSPKLNFEFIELLEEAGLPALVADYLGEPALMSMQKTTLRKADPTVSGAWHQDGFFLGPVRSLNLWLSLSRCGDESPGLDIIPRRLERYLATHTDDAALDFVISDRVVAEAAGENAVVRPIFEPGDALLFDELFLHRTGSEPSMPKPRFAVENWFFGASAFPEGYAPAAV